jgi:arginyl-tRNA synthetase
VEGQPESAPDFDKLNHVSEVDLVELISRLPEEVQRAAKELKPNLLANYAYELAKGFNAFYNQCPVLGAEPELRAARLALVRAARWCLGNTLRLLGIRAPEVM